ncbi:ArnT family glycosyltransferase [Ilumatobacter sp.]|uniref:ArnT family glycosyltransferase n=1 Tax=Ilumatobacter sp. TaxID=1967498 RepID=UPI002A2A65F7|nr:glycosyltransferase family 39 protein [Ilumatobacter sp.]
MSDDERHGATAAHRRMDIARGGRHALDTEFTEPPDRPIREDIRDPRFLRAVVVGLTIYLVSRLCVIAGAGVRAAQRVVDVRKDIADGILDEAEPSAGSTISNLLTSWDGRWYLEIVRGGYPEGIPDNITYEQLEARAAFFPVYPWLVRVVDFVLPGGDTFAALLTNFLLGAVSVVLVGVLARRLFSVAVAARSMTLYAVFPGSYVLSFAYAEATFIVLAALCLLFLVEERWLLAGLAAAVGTGTRPNGVALVAACAVAALLAIRRRRDWAALVSLALAPLGFIGFQLYVDAQTGERGAWFRVQREAWSEGTSFGATAVVNTFRFVTSPLSSPVDALTALTLMAMFAMLWCLWKRHLPLPLVAFVAMVIALMLIPETVTARPRFLFTAFPLFIAVGAWWPETDSDPDHHRASWDRAGWDAVLILGGAGLATLTGLYAVFGAIP